ncbi:unnamed protein product, partial [Coccothraustes coccothraustes]
GAEPAAKPAALPPGVCPSLPGWRRGPPAAPLGGDPTVRRPPRAGSGPGPAARRGPGSHPAATRWRTPLLREDAGHLPALPSVFRSRSGATGSRPGSRNTGASPAAMPIAQTPPNDCVFHLSGTLLFGILFIFI